MKPPPADVAARHAGRVGWMRSLGAMFYDALLLLSVWCVATALAIWMHGGRSIAAGDLKLPSLLLACAYLYFAGQWTRGGQTLGMKTWRIRLTTRDGTKPPGWSAASLRFAVAAGSLLALGLGHLWALWDAEGLTLPDRLSGTRRRQADDRP